MERGEPANKPQRDGDEKPDADDKSDSAQPPADRRAAAREKLQRQREARAKAKAVEAQAKLGPVLEKADRLMDKHRYHEAYQLLKKARQSVAPIADPDVQYRLTKLALIDDKPDKALDLLAPVLPAPNAAGYLDPRTLTKDELHPITGLLMLAGRAHNALAAREAIAAAEVEDKRASPAPDMPNTFFGVEAEDASASPAANPFADLELPNHLEGLDYLGVPIDAVTEKPALPPEAKQHANQALRIFDHLAGNATGEQTEAAWRCGRSLALLGRYGDALDAFAFAQHTLKSGYSSDLPDYLKPIAKGIAEDKKKVAYLHDVTRYGLEFLLYREAQKHRLAGRYKKAAAGYQRCIDSAQDTMTRLLIAKLSTDLNADTEAGRKKIAVDESPYTAASRLYQTLCLIEMGQAKEAVKQLEAFVDEDPATKLPTAEELAAKQATLLEDQDIPDPPGLYRGQALLELGRIALEHELDLERAAGYFARLDHWVTQARADNANWGFHQRMPGIKQAAKQKTDGPNKEYQKPDSWGNVKQSRIDPGMLVNRKTTPWYLDDLEEDSAKLRGFIYFARGESENAMDQWRRIIALDPETRDGNLATAPNDFTRLKFGAEHGYLVAYPEELKLYNQQQRLVILMADAAYVTQQWDRAILLYRDLLKGSYGELTSAQKDYPNFAIGQCLLRSGGRSGINRISSAAQYFEEVLASGDGTLSEYRAAFAISKLSRYSANQDLRDRSSELLQAMATSKKKNTWTNRARLKMAVALMHQNKGKEARQILESFHESDGECYEFAKYYLEQYKDHLK